MPLPHQTLTLYEEDDAIVRTDFSTDPAHPRPYLKRAALAGVSSSPDFLEGTSRIGQQTFQLVDPQTGATQRHRAFTAILADAFGRTLTLSRRMKLTQADPLGGADVVLFDGTLVDQSLNAAQTTFNLVVRDIRERERDVPLFVSNETNSLLPKGVVGGYGHWQPGRGGGAPGALIPDPGFYIGRADAAGYAGGYDTDPLARIVAIPFVTDGIYPEATARWNREHGQPTVGELNDGVLKYAAPRVISTPAGMRQAWPDLSVQWRDHATGGAWTTLRRMPWRRARFGGGEPDLPPHPAMVFHSAYPTDTGIRPAYLYVVLSADDALDLPPLTDDEIDIRVVSGMPPTEDVPLWLDDGTTFGGLLRRIAEGEFSDPAIPPRWRIDAASLAAFEAGTPRVRMKITKPEKDARQWVGPHIYKPMGMAPVVADDGEIEVVSGALPAAAPALVLDDTTCTFDHRSWKHGTGNAVTRALFTYMVDLRQPDGSLAAIDAHEDHVSPEAGLHGLKDLAYQPATVRAIYHGGGAVVPSDYSDPLASAIARARVRDTVDRRGYGGVPVYGVRASREDPAVAAARAGDWAVVGITSFPDYLSHLRGANRLAQILSIDKSDPVWWGMQLEDAGPVGGLLPLPVGVTAALVGDRARLSVPGPLASELLAEWAVGAGMPAAGSGRWTHLTRTDVPGDFDTPPVAPGATIWLRWRSVGPGFPSAWTYSAALVVPQTYALAGASVELDPVTGEAVVRWTHDPAAVLGVRVRWALRAPDDVGAPVYAGGPVDADAAPGLLRLGVTPRQRQRILVEVTPYSGFAAGAVLGIAGPPVIAEAQRDDRANPVLPTVRPVTTESNLYGSLELQIHDPQLRVLEVAFATARGNNPLGAFTVDPSAPFAADVLLDDRQGSKIGWRVRFVGADGTEGEPMGDVVPFGGQTVPLATMSIESTVAEEFAIHDRIAYGQACAEIDVWELETTTAPPAGDPPSVEFVGERLATMALPLRRDDGRRDVDFVLGASGNYKWRTYIPLDAIARRGPPLTRVTRGALVPPAVPPDLAAVAVGAAGPDAFSVPLDVTMPADVTHVSALRIYKDGAPYGADVPRTAAASAVQAVPVGGLTPGTTYTLAARAVSAAGVLSAGQTPAAGLVVTTDAAQLDPPQNPFATRTSPGVVTVDFDAGANHTLGSTVYRLWHSDDGVTYLDSGETTTGHSFLWDSATIPEFFELTAEQVGWLPSDPSDAVFA